MAVILISLMCSPNGNIENVYLNVLVGFQTAKFSKLKTVQTKRFHYFTLSFEYFAALKAQPFEVRLNIE